MAHNQRRFDPEKGARLLREERWHRWNPPQLLATAGVAPGQTVMDAGCGPGFWTLPIAEIVGPTGRVIALDVSEHLLGMLAEQNPPVHVHLVRGDLPNIDQPDASIDLIWAAFVFHEIQPPEAFAEELRRVLRPGGRLALLDWSPDATGEAGPPREHRYSYEQVHKYLADAGFRPLEQTWRDSDTYLVIAQ